MRITLAVLVAIILVSINTSAQTILKPTPLSKQYYGTGDSVSFDTPAVWAGRTQNK